MLALSAVWVYKEAATAPENRACLLLHQEWLTEVFTRRFSARKKPALHFSRFTSKSITNLQLLSCWP